MEVATDESRNLVSTNSSPRSSQRVPPMAFLRTLCAGRLGIAPADVTSDQLLEANTVANRLRYMLADNMGSPRAFEFRRRELAALAAEAEADGAVPTGGAAAAAAGVSDEAVLESYLASVLAPDGEMRDYLRHAKLAVRLGRALFVHGAVQPEAIGHVPGGAAGRIDDVDEWIARLNAFCAAEVAEWMADADAGRDPAWAGAADRAGAGFFERSGCVAIP